MHDEFIARKLPSRSVQRQTFPVLDYSRRFVHWASAHDPERQIVSAAERREPEKEYTPDFVQVEDGERRTQTPFRGKAQKELTMVYKELVDVGEREKKRKDIPLLPLSAKVRSPILPVSNPPTP